MISERRTRIKINGKDFDMKIDPAEIFRDAFDLGYLKDKGYIKEENLEYLSKLMEAEKEAKNAWEKLMSRHYQLEFMVLFMFNVIDDLTDKVDKIEGN